MKMKRQRISDLYEDFEPEIRIWPYVALGLLIPLVPLLLSYAVTSSFTWKDGARYLVSLLPLLFAALSMKDGEKSWLLLFSGLFYGAMVLLSWVSLSMEGNGPMPLGIPFALSLSPSLLPIASYSFFQKRKRGKWALPLVLAVLATATLAFFASYTGGNFFPYRALFPLLLLLLEISVFFVTRRTETTPVFLNIVLLLLLLSSSLFHSGILGILEKGGEGITVVSAILGIFVHDNEFWYVLSFFFVFSALASKSSYRVYTEEVEEEEEEESERISTPPSPGIGEKRGYSFPPDSSRFAPGREDSRKREETEAREEARPREERPRPEISPAPDDKWYQFIQGGVRDDERRSDDREYRRQEREDYPPRRSERYYDDDRDYYRPSCDRDYRNTDYRDDRYPVRSREYRESRHYDNRDYRDERDRYYRDVMDERAYRESRDRRMPRRRDYDRDEDPRY